VLVEARAKLESLWLTNAVRALGTHRTTFAILPIADLLRSDGPIAQLKARATKSASPERRACDTAALGKSDLPAIRFADRPHARPRRLRHPSRNPAKGPQARPCRLSRAGTLAALETQLQPKVAADGSGFHLLDSNEDALRWRLALVDSAEHSLDLQYYFWFADDSGDLLMKHVLDAADRGVKVRLLLDDISTWIEKRNTRRCATGRPRF